MPIWSRLRMKASYVLLGIFRFHFFHTFTFFCRVYSRKYQDVSLHYWVCETDFVRQMSRMILQMKVITKNILNTNSTWSILRKILYSLLWLSANHFNVYFFSMPLYFCRLFFHIVDAAQFTMAFVPGFRTWYHINRIVFTFHLLFLICYTLLSLLLFSPLFFLALVSNVWGATFEPHVNFQLNITQQEHSFLLYLSLLNYLKEQKKKKNRETRTRKEEIYARGSLTDKIKITVASEASGGTVDVFQSLWKFNR